jgi:uncharacterized protein with NRDE domain
MASLRDEHPDRGIAKLPVLSHSNPNKYISPIDPQGGGTWVGINNAGSAIVLLNGGFINHEKKEHYKRSRGQIVTELLSVNHPVKLWNEIDLENIEPFTLIVWSGSTLMQMVWDGEKKYQTQLDATKAQIWSSSTLYNDHDKLERQKKYEEWIESSNDKNESSILEFFVNGDGKNESVFIRNSQEIKTQSYTCIEINKDFHNTIAYHDFITESITHLSITNS